MRYHIVSLAAVFIALGIGIIVGSNTNFLGIRSLIERQDTVIGKLENNYKEIRKEVRETRAELEETQQRAENLEKTYIPMLLAGKLDGFRAGVIIISAAESGSINEEPLLASFKAAGTIVGYKLRTSLSQLDALAADFEGDFITTLSAELIEGVGAGSELTDRFIAGGELAAGGFERPVDGVIVILGDNLKLNLMRRLLLPAEMMIQEKDGLVVNLAYSEERNYRNIFRANHLAYYQDTGRLPGRIEAIAGLSEMFLQKKERERSGG